MKKVCSFCGRSDREVKLLISGLNGYICEDCAQQAYNIVKENEALNGKSSQSAEKSPVKSKITWTSM